MTAGGPFPKLALPLVKANIRCFSDNEIFVEILENVRGEDMFVLMTSFPANDHLMESPSMRCAAARRAASPRCCPTTAASRTGVPACARDLRCVPTS